MINSLTRADERFFRPETRPYLRDVYDHTVHAIRSLEASRDMIAGMLDIYTLGGQQPGRPGSAR